MDLHSNRLSARLCLGARNDQEYDVLHAWIIVSVPGYVISYVQISVMVSGHLHLLDFFKVNDINELVLIPMSMRIFPDFLELLKSVIAFPLCVFLVKVSQPLSLD